MVLQKQADGTHRWTSFEEGREHYLGIHHKSRPEGLNGTHVNAVYIGVDFCRHRFVRKVGDEYHSYSSLSRAPPARFMSEGCDGPVFEYVVTTYDGIVTGKKDREFVQQRLGGLEACVGNNPNPAQDSPKF